MHPWPAIGAYLFLKTLMNKQVIFPSILPHLQRGDTTILDLGCGLGQDIRALISDGVPSHNICALDYNRDLWDLGLELFNDGIGTGRGMEEVDFRQQDFLTQDIPEQWEGSMDFVFAGALYHLFDYEDQLILSRKTVKLLKPQPGSLIFGYQMGSTPAAAINSPVSASKSRIAFWHDRESFDKMWQDIGAELGIQFKTHMIYITENVSVFVKIDSRLAGTRFVVERVS